MSKEQKKQIIGDLAGALYTTKTLDEMGAVCQRLINEIYNCGFTIDRVPIVSTLVDHFMKSTITLLICNLGREKTKEFHEGFLLNVIALKTIVDLSLIG